MKMKLIQLICLMILVFGSDLNGQASKQARQKATTAAVPASATALQEGDFAVYSAVLDTLYRKNNPSVLVVDKEIAGCVRTQKNAEGVQAWQRSLDALPRKMPKLSGETVADFKRKLQVCRSLKAEALTGGKIILLEKTERQKIFTGRNVQQSWQQFQQKFSGTTGYINFSNVGFNADRTQALVNTYRKCGAKCGAEFMVLLAQVNGKWTVTATHKIWEL